MSIASMNAFCTAIGLVGGQADAAAGDVVGEPSICSAVAPGSATPSSDEPITLIRAPAAATPNVPPTIRNIESTPEATPALAGSTAFIAAVLIGDMTRPMPTPISTNAPARKL